MGKDYNSMWCGFAKESKWREYILPKRSDEEFYLEGELQAEALKKYITEFDSVLEFGCGIGRVLCNINSDKKTGVDVCQEFLDKIPDPNIVKIKSDGRSILGIDNESVDFIYSLMVFQHTKKEDHVNTLGRLYEILANGGKMLIQFPQNPNSYYKQSEFVNIYTKEEIISYCEACGITNFEILEDNLVGYGDGLVTPDTVNREYFLIINK
jgi:SAM-dependent methyltransferase